MCMFRSTERQARAAEPIGSKVMRLLSATVAAVAALAAAAPSFALDRGYADREPSVERVDLRADFRDPAQVRDVYARLQQAAMFVCGVQPGSDRTRSAADRACADQALGEAVGKLDRPLLTAMHQQSGAPMLARGY